MNILIYDPATPITYTDATLHQQALRGTESTIVRIAHALSRYHPISIAQHCRNTTDNLISNGVRYISFATAHTLSPDIVILLRHPALIEMITAFFPQARHFLWMHNLPSRHLYTYANFMAKQGWQIIAVSHFHRKKIEMRLQGKWYQRLFRKQKGRVPVHVLYNPIADDLDFNEMPIDSNQMIFTSSSYKGLIPTLKLFAMVREQFPEYELLIISPNDLDKDIILPKQARSVGPLPPHQLIQHIRESFCVFYPQTERVETFGLVYAEANAVGTPVLAHDFGAASEILSHPCQLINGYNVSTVIEKIREWREQRPIVKAKTEFKLSNVIQSWLRLFESNT